MALKFKFKLQIGGRIIEIEEEVENANAMFERIAFYDQWPTKGPEGANDVYFRFRVTKAKGFKYYSLVCPSKDKEFHFGQLSDGKNTLYPKHADGWVNRYHGAPAEEGEEGEVKQATTEDCDKLLRKIGLGLVREVLDKVQEILGVRKLPKDLTPEQRQKLFRELAQEAY